MDVVARTTGHQTAYALFIYAIGNCVAFPMV